MALVETGFEQATESSWHIDLPDFDDPDAVAVFVTEIHDPHRNDVRGVKTLRDYTKKYLDSTRLAAKHLRQVAISVNTINGVTTPGMRIGDPIQNQQRRLKRTTKKFYEMQSTAGLQAQCQLFGLDYDSFESREDVITALVVKNMEMAG